MSTTAVIPARYASTRLPGKPLLSRTGKPMIQHVVEAVRKARLVDHVVVATDDERIFQAVNGFGGQAVMTSPEHRCGTDRIAEAADILRLQDDDVVINVQGDEPEIPPQCIDKLVGLIQSCDCRMATLATPLSEQEADDPNKVKVVLDRNCRAMYFSRAPIPFDRDGLKQTRYLLHLGIYAYRVGFLKKFSAMPPTAAELSEKLEQLRALESGYAIAVGVVDYAGRGIDTPADYDEFVVRQAAKG